MGSLYATKSLGMIYRQNDKMLSKQDAQLQKYDTIIEQNKAIIALLERGLLAKKKKISGYGLNRFFFWWV